MVLSALTALILGGFLFADTAQDIVPPDTDEIEEVATKVDLYAQLKTAPNRLVAGRIVNDIHLRWRDSGSAVTDIMMRRARAAIAIGAKDKAREYYDRIILFNNDYAHVWYERAKLFALADDPADAIQDLREVLDRDPMHFEAWLALGRILEGFNGEAEAVIAYEKVLEIYPLNAEAKQGVRRLKKTVDGKLL